VLPNSMSVGRFQTVDPIEDCSFGATISVTMASIGSVISCVSAVRGGIGSMIATLERPGSGRFSSDWQGHDRSHPGREAL